MDPSYNNSFGPSPTPAQPVISSGSDDVTFPSAPARKSKKPLILTIIIILVAAIGGVGAWWYLSSAKTNQSSEQPPVEKTVKQAFNIYANNLLYGEKNSDQDFNIDTIIETYNINNPNIYIESADSGEIESINDDFIVFSELYNKPATTEDLSVYFYGYEKSKLSGKTDLSDDEIMTLRENAMTTFAEIYYVIYNIDIITESGTAL